MKSVPLLALVTCLAGSSLAAAQENIATPICVTVDETRDTFSPEDRSAALLLVARQFEAAGVRLVPADCSAAYELSHVRLGNTITVTLSGPNGRREGMALGLDDLPALYSQMVRSMVTGRPMSGMNVVDRTNVTVSDASSLRVHTDSFAYARLGYGSILANQAKGAPTMGFGYRAELDSFALDVSFLNLMLPSSQPNYYASGGFYESEQGSAGSMLKLEALYFVKPRANASAYLGGGLSWGRTEFSKGTTASFTSLRGSGLQGELTVGYELPRASTLRLFVQADAVLPFYTARLETMTFPSRTVPRAVVTTTTGRRYTPSLGISVGLGWQRHRR